jgi:hypothetical protein
MPAVASARANNTAAGQKDRQVCGLSRCPGSILGDFAASQRAWFFCQPPKSGSHFAELIVGRTPCERRAKGGGFLEEGLFPGKLIQRRRATPAAGRKKALQLGLTS